MCGIVYIKRLDGRPASKMVEKRYRAQKSRGSEGFGYIAMEAGKVVEYSRSQTEKDIMKNLNQQHAEEVIFHHRFPTSAPNFPQTAHPIRVTADCLEHDYIFVHNGICTNDKELRKKYTDMGFKYSTDVTSEWRADGELLTQETQWNDSESFGISMALAIENGEAKIDATGSIAFIMLQMEKNTANSKKLFWGRNHNPLKMETVKGHFVSLTSEGIGKDVEAHILYSMDYASYEVEEKDFSIGYKYTYKKEDVKSELDRIWPERHSDHQSNYNYDRFPRIGAGFDKNKTRPEDDVFDEFDDEYYILLEEKIELDSELREPYTTDVEAEKISDRLVVVKQKIKEYEQEEQRRAMGSHNG